MTRRPAPRADEADDDFIETWGLPMGAGTVSQLTGQRCGRWRNPHKEFPIGFHFAAPGPSFEDRPAPARRKRPAAKKPAAKKGRSAR